MIMSTNTANKIDRMSPGTWRLGNSLRFRSFVRKRGTAILKLALIVPGVFLAAVVGLSMLVTLPTPAAAADKAQVARGKYLVGIGGCNDCHTPGYSFGKPDMARFLSGSEVGFEIPGVGVFYGRILRTQPHP
jgi:mono/diheme cytochrome c family protein